MVRPSPSTITRDAAEDLSLAEGDSVTVLVKLTEVIGKE